MKLIYEYCKTNDIVYICTSHHKKKYRPGYAGNGTKNVIFDFDNKYNLMGIEIVNASKVFPKDFFEFGKYKICLCKEYLPYAKPKEWFKQQNEEGKLR